MYIDGDLCFFAGAAATDGEATPIGKVLNTIEAPFESGANYPVYMDYVAVVDVAGKYPWNRFTRVPQVKELDWDNIINKPTFVVDPHTPPFTPTNKSVLQRLEELEAKNAVFKSGWGMILWNKPANLIPVGWAEVEDFRGKMPVGMNISVDGSGNPIDSEFTPLAGGVPGRTGGAKSKQLSINELPKHKFKVFGEDNSAEATAPNGEVSQLNNGPSGSFKYTNELGNDEAFSILNPFRTVLFIEWVGL
jgi:hypothetical protein